MATDESIPNYNPQRFQYVRICACGCGSPTTLPVQTNNQRGIKKGQPVFYAQGHSLRTVTTKSYRRAQGHVDLHRVRAEASRGGKPLPPKAVIHHPDEDPWNRDARLVICEDAAYHKLLHVRMRIKKAGGNPNTDRICPFCGQVKPLSEFFQGKSNYYCKPCRSLYDQARRETLRQRKIDTRIT